MSRRLALPPGWNRTRMALALAMAMALCLALAPGELAPASLRAGAAVAAIGALALLARARLARPADARRLTLVSRQALSREAGVALLEVDGRPMLVGFGGGAVQLLPISMGEPSAPRDQRRAQAQPDEAGPERAGGMGERRLPSRSGGEPSAPPCRRDQV